MRLPLVGDQRFLLERPKGGVDSGGHVMEVRRNSRTIAKGPVRPHLQLADFHGHG
jgi:hypothetical protein